MAGERDLAKLFSQLTPTVQPETFVFCSFPDFKTPFAVEPIATFREVEGLTAIVSKKQADALRLEFAFECTMITLSVHSSLEAIGFLARISAALAAKDIPCNFVSGYYHDHVFVPPQRVSDALDALAALASSLSAGRQG